MYVAAAMAAFSLFSGEVSRQDQLEQQSIKNLDDARSMREQATENLRRLHTGLLQAPKELERRASIVNNAMAGQGVDIQSSGDLLLAEAGNILQQTSFQLEEANYDYIQHMKSANNLEKLAKMQQASGDKLFGIF